MEKDFSTSPDKVGREATLSALVGTGKLQSLVVDSLQLKPDRLKDWVLRAVTPLNMRCTEFGERDITAYGQQAYTDFALLVASAYASPESGGITPMVRGTSRDQLRDEKKYPVVAVLRAINSKITKNSDGSVRKKGEDAMDSIPLSPEEVERGKKISKEGFLSIVRYDKPFKNAYGEMVSGDFVYYPEGDKVAQQLEKMNNDFLAATQGTKDDIAHINAAGRLMRRCISIHPFHDGNGGSCTVLAVWALARSRIPHSLLWSGEDILLLEEVWLGRFRQGVEAHRRLLQDLGR